MHADILDGQSSSSSIIINTLVWNSLKYKLNSRYRDLESEVNATQPSTILHWAQAAGMKTGFVTTTRMSHATPAALYSRTASRFWECEQVRVDTKFRGIYRSDTSTSRRSWTM